MSSSTLTIDNGAVQELTGQISRAIADIQKKRGAANKITKHDRTRWSQLLTHAKRLMNSLSLHAKEALERMCAELGKLLKTLKGNQARVNRTIRAHACPTH